MSWQADTPKLILASASSARASLLRAAGLRFEVRPADIDEAEVRRRASVGHMAASATALELARLKAEQAAASEPDALVIGCDQLLVLRTQWFEKPADVDAARMQLRALRNETHTLVTTIVCHQGKEKRWQHVAEPRLTMRDFSDAFLEEYLSLEREHVTASVGAYRLEGPGVHLFESIAGEYSAILGLPLLPLLGFLRRYGILLN
jgi:septum formation protein